MNEALQVVFLAVLQGIAEFLPISSSGHLVIFKHLLHDLFGGNLAETTGIELEIALHVGTLLSVLVVYRKELFKWALSPRIWMLVILASIPAAVVGLLLKKRIEALFEAPIWAGCGLLVSAFFLLLSKRLESGVYDFDRLPSPIAFVVGCFQAMALPPGISRSGSTIAGGLMFGMTREAAAKFSFLISLPAVAGATLLETKDIYREGFKLPIGLLILGAVVSFIVGVVALNWLIQMIAKHGVYWFGHYCLVVGIAVIVWQLVATSRTTAPVEKRDPPQAVQRQAPPPRLLPVVQSVTVHEPTQWSAVTTQC